LKKVVKSLKKLFLGILFSIFIYLLFSIILSIIPENKKFKETINSEYVIIINSNGVHLDIILPAKNTLIDWNNILSAPEKAEFIGFGWGDKQFYINTPEWSDLKFSIAFKALFFQTNAAIHVTFYNKIDKNNIKIKVSKQQFKDVQSFILKSFKTKDKKLIPIKEINYGINDSFYEANYSYSLFYTCNTWTNEALKKAGLPACVWTPFDKGILFQYRKYQNNN